MLAKRFSEFLCSERGKVACIFLVMVIVAVVGTGAIVNYEKNNKQEQREFFGYRDEVVFDYSVQATVDHKAYVGSGCYLGVIVEDELFYDMVSPSTYNNYNIGDKYSVKGQVLLRRHA